MLYKKDWMAITVAVQSFFVSIINISNIFNEINMKLEYCDRVIWYSGKQRV